MTEINAESGLENRLNGLPQAFQGESIQAYILLASSVENQNQSLPTQAKEPTALLLASREPVYSLEARFARNFNEQSYCDMTIVARGRSIKTHKAVICPASPVIARALNGNFQEGQTNTYTFQTEREEVVWGFVQHCYLGQYDTVKTPEATLFIDRVLEDEGGIIHISRTKRLVKVPSLSKEQIRSRLIQIANTLNTQRLVLDMEMWRMGDIYDVPALKLTALSCLKIHLDVLLLQKDEQAAEPFLNIIKPVYDCTASDEDEPRKLLVLYRRLFIARFTSQAAKKRLGTLAAEIKDFGSALVEDYVELLKSGGNSN